MGTENATLRFAVLNTNWVNATFLWLTSRRPISGDRGAVDPGKPGTRTVSSFMQRLASFLHPGESYLALILKRLRATR